MISTWTLIGKSICGMTSRYINKSNFLRIIGQSADKVTAAIAQVFTESEFEQYRIVQGQLYQSSLDWLIARTKN